MSENSQSETFEFYRDASFAAYILRPLRSRFMGSAPQIPARTIFAGWASLYSTALRRFLRWPTNLYG